MFTIFNKYKAFLILALSCVVFAPTGAYAAEFAIILKSGATFLSDDTQRLDGEVRNFDDTSEKTLGLAWEIRNSRNVGMGMEYMSFEHNFDSPSSDGYARTQLYLFSAKKYFAAESMVHPFLGVGLGWGYSKFLRTGDIDRDWNTALQISTGIEIRPADEFGIYIEAKGLASNTDGERENEFDFSGGGLLAGVSFIF